VSIVPASLSTPTPPLAPPVGTYGPGDSDRDAVLVGDNGTSEGGQAAPRMTAPVPPMRTERAPDNPSLCRHRARAIGA